MVLPVESLREEPKQPGPKRRIDPPGRLRRHPPLAARSLGRRELGESLASQRPGVESFFLKGLFDFGQRTFHLRCYRAIWKKPLE